MSVRTSKTFEIMKQLSMEYIKIVFIYSMVKPFFNLKFGL